MKVDAIASIDAQTPGSRWRTSRRRTRTQAAAGLIGVILLAVFAAGTVVPAAKAEEPANSASEGVSVTRLQRSRSYWTPQRMAAAKPVDALRTRINSSPQRRAETYRAAPTLVPPRAGRSVREAGLDVRSAVPRRAQDVPRPYTGRPDRLNGKVFFTIGSSAFVCSGTVVNSRNRDMVDTAGHCVSDGSGQFHQNWVFVPGYSSDRTGCKEAGCYPFDIWPARRLTVSTQWHRFANYRQDLGYALLQTRNGRHIVDVVGGQGSAFNMPRNLRWISFGYPQEPPFDGFDQKFCLSWWAGADVPSEAPGPRTIRIGCDMTGGASGGGWVFRLSRSGLGFINGHNSYRYLGGAESTQLYGPYYGSEALALFRFTETR